MVEPKELHLHDKKARLLSEPERALLQAMLNSRSDNFEKRLEGAFVRDMSDGGMGSVRFENLNAQRTAKLGKTIAEAEYIDSDGIPVQISVSLDEEGELFEIDFWKVNFSALRTYPMPSQLKIKEA